MEKSNSEVIDEDMREVNKRDVKTTVLKSRVHNNKIETYM